MIDTKRIRLDFVRDQEGYWTESASINVIVPLVATQEEIERYAMSIADESWVWNLEWDDIWSDGSCDNPRFESLTGGEITESVVSDITLKRSTTGEREPVGESEVAND